MNPLLQTGLEGLLGGVAGYAQLDPRTHRRGWKDLLTQVASQTALAKLGRMQEQHALEQKNQENAAALAREKDLYGYRAGLERSADAAKTQQEATQREMETIASPQSYGRYMHPGMPLRPGVMDPGKEYAPMGRGRIAVPPTAEPNLAELSAMAIDRQRRQAAQNTLLELRDKFATTQGHEYGALKAGSEAPGGEMYGVDLSGKQALLRDRDLSATKTGREIANMPTQEQARIRNMNATGESFYDLMNKAGRGPQRAGNGPNESEAMKRFVNGEISSGRYVPDEQDTDIYGNPSVEKMFYTILKHPEGAQRWQAFVGGAR